MDVIPDFAIEIVKLSCARCKEMGTIRLVTLNAMQTGDGNRVIGHGFLRKQKKGSLGVTRLPEWGWFYALLTLAAAPAVIQLVAEPDSAVLFPAFHLALMDRAPVGHGLIVMIVIVVIHLAVLVIGDILAVMEAVVLAGQELVILEPVQGSIGFFQQILAGITPQGELADEAVGRDIAGIPRCRGFGHQGVALEGSIFGHF
jgi:hypothetical protein